MATWAEGRAEPIAHCPQVQSLVSRCTCPVQFSMVKVSEGKYRVGDSNTLIFIRVSPWSGVEGPLWGRQNQVSFRGTLPRPEGKDRKSPFIPSYQALGLSFSPLENSRRFLTKLASMSPPSMKAARNRTPPICLHLSSEGGLPSQK